MGSDLVVLNIWDKYIGVIWREFRRHKQYCVTTLAKAKWLTSPVTQWRNKIVKKGKRPAEAEEPVVEEVVEEKRPKKKKKVAAEAEEAPAAAAKGGKKQSKSVAPGADGAPVDKVALEQDALKEIEEGIAKPNSQKDGKAFIPKDWHIRFGPVLGKYRKFLNKHADKYVAVDTENGKFTVMRAGEAPVQTPRLPWKKALETAWKAYCIAVPRDDRDVKKFIHEIPGQKGTSGSPSSPKSSPSSPKSSPKAAPDASPTDKVTLKVKKKLKKKVVA